MLRIYSFIIFLSTCFSAAAQIYPRGYFQSPLNIPLYLSGNFGEIRTNHFHTGLDIKTEGREGLPVYAAADGFVSRIKVSAVGYGNIVYVEHPNGYTTAYAHLQSYNQRISAYTESRQYSKQSFEIDLALKPGEIPIKKGEILGLSGNSGGSGGPHLHFEIRETKSEKAVNPLLFGFNIPDQVKPNIAGIRVFALNDYSNVNGKSYAVFSVQGKGGEYILKPGQVIQANGEVGFALHTTDMLDGNANRCGIYTIEMYIDDTLAHKQQMEKIDFNMGRYLNAHCDYKQFKRTKSSIHKCFIEPNNKLEIYPFSPGRGKVTFKDDQPHRVRFVVSDAYGNTSSISTTVQSTLAKVYTGSKASANERLLEWNKRFNPVTEFYELDFPVGNLYRNELVKLQDHGQMPGFYSHVLEFGDDEIPVHSNYKIKLAPAGLPENLRPFAFLAQLSDSYKISRFLGKKMEGKYMTGESKVFGKYAIVIDSITPFIKALNVTEGKEFSPGQRMIFSANDSQSGIGTYDLYIDGKWALMTYDAKYARFSYKIDPDKILPGIHRLQFAVTDNVGNSRTFECNFVLR
jgi:hypothetical protein